MGRSGGCELDILAGFVRDGMGEAWCMETGEEGEGTDGKGDLEGQIKVGLVED